MRRFLALVFLVSLAIPAGVSITGCTRNPGASTCNGLGFGLKTTDVASIVLQPQIAGISLAYGQTTQARVPTAYSCKGDTIQVSGRDYTYGTSNNQLVDISPSGAICAGTWNRNSGGGIPDYTYCNPPAPAPATGNLPYAVAYMTATAHSVTSNPVAVYVHAPVTSVSLVGPQSCQSQGSVNQLDAEACYAQPDSAGKIQQYEMCAPASVSAAKSYSCPGGLAPGVTSVPECPASIGTMSFIVGTASVAKINSVNNQITAEQPGTTAITASIAGSGSSAGYFSTCPPASITTTLANGATSGTVTQGTPQTVATTVYDTNGQQITGLDLTYQSTNQLDINVGAGGTITSSFPGVASVTAICQPGICNPAPINVLGMNGTGLSIASNPVNIITPGTTSNYIYFAAPGTSQYFVTLQQLTGTGGSTTRLPYVPNSFVMDERGVGLYFGSPRELMMYSTTSDAIGRQDTSVPGVVLAVAPDNSLVLINDQARHLFYLYNPSSGSASSFPGMGNAAAWTPDAKTLYITDNAELNTPAACGTPLISGHTNTLYVYNANTGWNEYPLPPSPLPPDEIPSCSLLPNTAPPIPVQQNPAVMIPSVGAYLRGTPTEARTWCPSGTVGDAASITYYPLGDPGEAVQSDTLAATVEGHHILSAEWTTGGGITLHDISINIPGTKVNGILSPQACQVTTNPTTNAQTMLPLTIGPTSVQSVPLPVSSTTGVNQVVTGETPVPVPGETGTSLAFVTYDGTGTNAVLPYYLPAAGGAAGSVGQVALTGASSITAPLVGVFSPDNTYFYLSTAGDNKIHFIQIPNSISATSVPTDSLQMSPNLPACSVTTDGGCTYTGSAPVVPATAIVVKPRPVT